MCTGFPSTEVNYIPTPNSSSHVVDYLELIDWTERAVRDDKRGSIATDKRKLVTGLGISNDAWLTSAKQLLN